VRRIACIIALTLCFAALVAGVQKLKAYRESHSSGAAAIQAIKALEQGLEKDGAVRSGPHSWTYPDNSTNALLTSQTAQLRQILHTVTVADGVSKPEAEIIAECYFHQNVGCGSFTGIRDGGTFWIVDGVVGYAAQPIEGFQIDKRSGKIKSPIGPSYATPFEIFP
jgi:hypothetical protein